MSISDITYNIKENIKKDDIKKDDIEVFTIQEIDYILDKIQNKVKELRLFDLDIYETELRLIKKYNKLLLENYKLYKLEDNDLFKILEYLIPKLNKKYNKNYSKEYFINETVKFNKLILYIKNKINRPRPYQIAKYLNNNEIKILESNSANTPSCPSGHAFQGFMLFYLIKKHYGIELLNYATDIGNRRIMAGLHFVGDNIISYYLFRLVIDMIHN